MSVMGLAVRIEADDRELLNVAGAALHPWPFAAPGASHDLRITLHRGRDDPVPAGEPRIDVEGGRLRVAGPGMHASAVASERAARAVVPPHLIRDPEALAAELLDTLLLFLVTRSGRIPLHASALLAEGTALLFAGPSSSGKSSLAMAGQRRGIPVLSEDTVYIQIDPLRVWGFPRPIHLLPPPASRGPEGSLRCRAGRWKVAVPLTQPWRDPPAASRAALFLLEPDEAVGLQSLESTSAIHSLIESLAPGFDHFRAELPEALAALTSGGAGAWRLTLSRNPDEALDRVLATLSEKTNRSA